MDRVPRDPLAALQKSTDRARAWSQSPIFGLDGRSRVCVGTCEPGGAHWSGKNLYAPRPL